jgi:hypothetical protein
MAACPNCHHDLPEDSESGRCPHCGHAWIKSNFTSVGTLEVTRIEIGYGAQKSWLEQWGQVERSNKKIQDLYQATAVDNLEAQTVLKDFFIHSWHLGDWLVKDATTSIDKRDIGTLLRGEPDMAVCKAMANTAKHHTLDNENKMSARIRTLVTKPHGQATIEISTPGGNQERDALELATSCMAIWQKFLESHGLRT